MGWLSMGVSNESSSGSKNESQYGYRKVDPSQEWKDAFKELTTNLNSDGTNAYQKSSLDWMKENMTGSPVTRALTGANDYLTGLQSKWDSLGDRFTGLADQTTRQATAANAQGTSANAHNSEAGVMQAVSADGTSSGSTPMAQGLTAKEFADQYSGLYGSAVTDPALAAFDRGTDKAVNNLNARTAAGGGWANTRASAIPYGDLYTDAALGRAKLSSELNTSGLNSALSAARGDADRLTGVNVSNASNMLNNNQFNAQMGQNNNQFNAGNKQAANLFNAQNTTQNNQFNANANQQNSQFNATQGQQNNQFNANQNQQNSQFNVNAANQQDTTKLAAIQAAGTALQQKAGLSQQQFQNVVTANGIDTAAAQRLFENGTITQMQLGEILSAAAQINGSSFQQNTDTQSTADSTTISGKVG